MDALKTRMSLVFGISLHGLYLCGLAVDFCMEPRGQDEMVTTGANPPPFPTPPCTEFNDAL